MGENLRPSKSLPHVCTREQTTYSRPSLVDSCPTEAPFKNANAEHPRKFKRSMPALPSDSHLSSSGANYPVVPAQEPSRLLASSTNHSSDISFVSLDPPVTREILSELDIPRLENSLIFRHDLNFNPKIQFRVNTQCPQAEERRERERRYWHALAAEIASWLGHYQSIGDSPSSHTLCIPLPGPGTQSFPQRAPLRLPRLFGAIRDILKHLLPSEQWPMVEAVLDVRLLMQQLEHGICDFIGLSDWLSNYLRRFCSPTRDCMLDTMASAIRLGVENANTDSIVHGLITLFEVFRGMSMDATNSAIRKLRLAWVERTITYEQTVFLRLIADGWDMTGARTWFHDLQEADQEPRPGLWIFAKALKDAVSFYHLNFPPTLTLDYDRLRILQFDFQILVYQAACRRTLTQTLRVLGWTGKISQASYAGLFSKVAVLISGQELQYDYWQMRKPVALEIVRAAYTVCSNSKLPISENLDFAEDYLRRCCNPTEQIFGVLRSSLAADLGDKVDEEVCAGITLTSAQLMRRLSPQQRHFSVQSEAEGLVHIAKRIAHIAELHWRIWGPILYERPVHVVGRALGHETPVEEGQDGEGSSHCGENSESDELPRDTVDL